MHSVLTKSGINQSNPFSDTNQSARQYLASLLKVDPGYLNQNDCVILLDQKSSLNAKEAAFHRLKNSVPIYDQEKFCSREIRVNDRISIAFSVNENVIKVEEKNTLSSYQQDIEKAKVEYNQTIEQYEQIILKHNSLDKEMASLLEEAKREQDFSRIEEIELLQQQSQEILSMCQFVSSETQAANVEQILANIKTDDKVVSNQTAQEFPDKQNQSDTEKNNGCVIS